MLKLTYKDYVIYFTSACLKEPFHLHVNSPIPCRSGAAKLWISKDREYIIEDQGQFSKEELSKLYKKFIKNNLSSFETDWRESSGVKVIVYSSKFESFTNNFG